MILFYYMVCDGVMKMMTYLYECEFFCLGSEGPWVASYIMGIDEWFYTSLRYYMYCFFGGHLWETVF